MIRRNLHCTKIRDGVCNLKYSDQHLLYKNGNGKTEIKDAPIEKIMIQIPIVKIEWRLSKII